MSQQGTVLSGPASVVLRSVGPRARHRSSAAEVNARQWLARELHDNAAQVLTGMVIDMERMKGEQAGRRTALEAIDSLQTSTRTVLASIRQTMHTLRDEPVNVPDLADWLHDILERFHSETGIETRLMGQESWPSTLSTHASINLFRIVEEALHNVRLHSGAQLVLVSLSMDDGTARLYVRDDGRGRANIDRSWRQGSGTVGMRERAILLGGDLRVESVFGHGLAIEVRIPADCLTS